MDHQSAAEQNLAELTSMIRAENDPDKRSVLMVCQGMVGELIEVAEILNSTRREHTSRINDHQTRLKDHDEKLETHDTIADRAQTLLKVCVFMVTVSSGAVIAAGSYTYSLIADLRDLVTQHDIRIKGLVEHPHQEGKK